MKYSGSDAENVEHEHEGILKAVVHHIPKHGAFCSRSPSGGDVENNVEKQDGAGNSLQHVHPIFHMAVVLSVILAAEHDVEAVESVEKNGEKNKSYFQANEKLVRDDILDFFDLFAIGIASAECKGVRINVFE